MDDHGPLLETKVSESKLNDATTPGGEVRFQRMIYVTGGPEGGEMVTGQGIIPQMINHGRSVRTPPVRLRVAGREMHV
jgi:hypothetical protein